MKASRLTRFVLVPIFAAATIPTRLAAQDRPRHYQDDVRYTVKALTSLGGTSSTAEGVNNKGWLAGDSDLQGDRTEHAFVWRNGVVTDLGTMGGLNSWAASINERGLVAGGAQTSVVDPLGEDWGSGIACGISPCDGYQNLVLAFAWQQGVMTPLPTLGGNNGWVLGFNGAVNKRGQVVGFTETAIQDPNCIAPQKLVFEAVIWGPKAGEIHELPLLPGDSVSAAAAINDHGQVVGGAGPICGPPSTAGSLHAVLWERDSVSDLGNLGGVMNNVAWALNNHGQVVGFSDLAGDQTTHAFLWQRGMMEDLGTLPNDVASFAYSINDTGQVVGQSLDQSGNSRAFIWQDGAMTDLNSLIPPDSSLYLIQPFSINDAGEIAGQAFHQSSGATLAVLLVPCDEKHAQTAGCDDKFADTAGAQESSERARVVLPENVREQLRGHRGFRSSSQPGCLTPGWAAADEQAKCHVCPGPKHCCPPGFFCLGGWCHRF